MIDDILAAARQLEEAMERDKAVVVCHRDDEQTVRRALDEARKTTWVMRRVDVVVSEFAQPGQVLWVNRSLDEMLRQALEESG